ncbi:MAG: DUF2927 domain-containing protein [Rhodobacteraceae bacterium]|nr:DUF2927 domain-containing protein [Paracoccaceae bacterium]
MNWPAYIGRAAIVAAALAVSGCEIPDILPPQESTPAARGIDGAIPSGGQRIGLFAGDAGDTDPPEAAALAADFQSLAFGGAQMLQRWKGPVHISFFFGVSMTTDRRAADKDYVAALAVGLEHFTGHPIKLSQADPSIRVFVMDAAELRSASTAALAAVTGQGGQFCTISTAAGEFGKGLLEVDVYIRSDIPGAERHACYQEMIARALGLHHSRAMHLPSLFSDDGTIESLTRNDYILLRMLYDPRLRPGMTRAGARPVISLLAEELGRP